MVRHFTWRRQRLTGDHNPFIASRAGNVDRDAFANRRQGGAEAANALLSDTVVANIGDDFGRMGLRTMTKALFVGSQAQSPRWPEAPTLTEALAPFGVRLPTPNFLARYGVYVVPSALKTNNSVAYLELQQALLQARASPEFQNYIAKSQLQDLSIGRPGEDFETAFATDMVEIRKIK